MFFCECWLVHKHKTTKLWIMVFSTTIAECYGNKIHTPPNTAVIIAVSVEFGTHTNVVTSIPNPDLVNCQQLHSGRMGNMWGQSWLVNRSHTLGKIYNAYGEISILKQICIECLHQPWYKYLYISTYIWRVIILTHNDFVMN